MEFYNPFGVSQGKMSIVIKKKYAARPPGARGGTAARQRADVPEIKKKAKKIVRIFDAPPATNPPHQRGEGCTKMRGA